MFNDHNVTYLNNERKHMLELKLAYRNLVGAKLRTVLNVGILSFIYVLIIWHQSLFNGMYGQASQFMIKDDIGGGQYWFEKYDPYDLSLIDDIHGKIPEEIEHLIQHKQAAPILIRPASFFPKGRIQSVLLKGIEPEQTILDIPTTKLGEESGYLPIMVGRLMAKKNFLQDGDTFTIQWRDANGTFDAVEGKIVEIMNSFVPAIDKGQMWVSLDKLQKMSVLEDEATIIVVGKNVKNQKDLSYWTFRNPEYLLQEVTAIVSSKRGGSIVLYMILLFLAMLAIFDTQVLSIFRRRKEIGTLMALGMVRSRIIKLFTLEGALNGILGMMLASLYGAPLLILSEKHGIPLPFKAENAGMALTPRLYSEYSAGLILGTILIVLLTVTFVSYLPSRKISGVNPTEALRGKIS